ncbi:MAG: rRNA cytosine-C5-methylase [Alistipes sp.]|jgi:16S rRNA C967 or C1407 C5-methylase (RsmB/RsmF family)|nr:rRNA cytosine-C5-methylase [Alistipes sp.]
MFPPEFERSVSAEPDAAELLAALDGEAVTSVRYNPFKLAAMPAEAADRVPWNRYGAYLGKRPVFTLDPAMHSGAYYVQEASSQFVEFLLRSAFGGELGRVRILDLCAAPGGKATLYSTLAGPEGLVVANEVIRARAGVLADNVKRWGVGNVAVTCNEPRDLAAYRHWFDVLAVDAPCSGEGMFRKNREARVEWSPAHVEMCAARQRKILAEAWDALRPGGVLIYSTCTFNRRENEDNVAWLAENFAVDPVDIEVPSEWGVECGEVGGIATFRFWPHRVRGEGFFAAVMSKAEGRVKLETPRARREPLAELNRPESRPLAEWVATPEAMKFARAGDNCYGYYRPVCRDVAALAGGLNVIYSGVCLGQVFGGKLRPDHALALFHGLAPGGYSVTELTREEALDYLRKREFGAETLGRLAEGLNLLTRGGLPVGWTKRIGHRSNTMLPNSFRIVNL